jgi:hypothetical protein
MAEQHGTEAFGGSRIFCGNVIMAVPAGEAHLRQAEIALPAFSSAPAITTTVFSPQSDGEAFAIYNIDVVREAEQTVIKFWATNVQTGVPSDLQYWCSYMVVGPGVSDAPRS